MNTTPRPSTPGQESSSEVKRRGRGRPPKDNFSEEEKKKIILENQRAWREAKLKEDPNYYKKYTKKCPIHVVDGITNQCLICYRKDVTDSITWNHLENKDPEQRYSNFLFKLVIKIVEIPNYNLHMISYYDEFNAALPKA